MSTPGEHSHGSTHEHDKQIHPHPAGLWAAIRHGLLREAHVHVPANPASQRAILNDRDAIRTVWLAFVTLLLTSLVQVAIISVSGSVALLADTAHNIGDGLNSIPLLLAFYLARRAATRRYTYGFGRAEDVAGIFIVLSIAFSAGVILWESSQKLLHPQPVTNTGWLLVAGLIGFLGNEAVAWLQIRAGRRIGSAALVADGLHARSDGLTSLAVLAAAIGSWVGLPNIDPLVGLLIGLLVLFISRDAARAVWYRLMDAVEPQLVAMAEDVVRNQEGVRELRRLRMRWCGHDLLAEISICVSAGQSLEAGHQVAEQVRDALFHRIPGLAEAAVHVDPWSGVEAIDHELAAHHELTSVPVE